MIVRFNNVFSSLQRGETFEHREQDVAHFASPRSTIERVDGDKGAAFAAGNKTTRAYLRVTRFLKKTNQKTEAQTQASIQLDKLEGS